MKTSECFLRCLFKNPIRNSWWIFWSNPQRNLKSSHRKNFWNKLRKILWKKNARDRFWRIHLSTKRILEEMSEWIPNGISVGIAGKHVVRISGGISVEIHRKTSQAINAPWLEKSLKIIQRNFCRNPWTIFWKNPWRDF